MRLVRTLLEECYMLRERALKIILGVAVEPLEKPGFHDGDCLA